MIPNEFLVKYRNRVQKSKFAKIEFFVKNRNRVQKSKFAKIEFLVKYRNRVQKSKFAKIEFFVKNRFLTKNIINQQYVFPCYFAFIHVELYIQKKSYTI